MTWAAYDGLPIAKSWQCVCTEETGAFCASDKLRHTGRMHHIVFQGTEKGCLFSLLGCSLID